MPLIVQKYGGTSVATPQHIKNIAQRIAQHHHQGNQLIIILSAMSGVTDRLIHLAQQITPNPTHKELDMLLATGEQTTIALAAMALHNLNLPATPLTGPQAGIHTDHTHTKAKITNITTRQIRQTLQQGNIPIIAGFQGQTPDGAITTLGRGGSDLTAIAIAAALKADHCQIYTDVDGVHTADPRQIPNAKKITHITYDEMLELASAGAKVMQNRAVEFAKKYHIPFEVRSSLNHNPGTMITQQTPNMENIHIRGLTLDTNQSKITLIGIPDQPGIAAHIFQALHNANLNIDIIIQNTRHNQKTPTTDLSFTLDKTDLPTAKKTIQKLQKKIHITKTITQQHIAKLSIVGIGMKSHSGIAAKLFETLAQHNINIDLITTSEIKISLIINPNQAQTALQAAHHTFIEQPNQTTQTQPNQPTKTTKTTKPKPKPTH